MKKLIFVFVAVVIFVAGFMVANVIGFKNIAEAADNIWRTIGNVIFNQDLGKSVGIGTKTPSEKLSVVGKIESTDGGFKFPDGTVQVTAGDKNLHLYDANGQDLGVLVNVDTKSLRDYETYIPSESLFIRINVGAYKNDLSISGTGYSGGTIYFDQLDCNGIAYSRDLGVPNEPIELYGLIRSLRDVKYAGAPQEQFNSLSYANGSGGCNNNSESHLGYALANVSLPFTEPLAYPLSIR